MDSSESVFLNYSKAELDRNFDQRGWIQNAEEIIARNELHSARACASLEAVRDLAYGTHPDETVDIFVGPKPNGTVQIFVHGGAWKNFSKNDYSFPAISYCAAGVTTVVVNFSKLPAARIPDVADQVSRAVSWVYRNVSSFGGDPDRIFMSAHSSGAHLTANALQTNWSSLGLPQDIVKSAALVSGPYDLVPVMRSARSTYVKLSEDEVEQYSPVRNASNISCPIFVAYADGDTDEFRRQSREFASALQSVGKLSLVREFSGLNHFEIMEEFVDPDSPLVQSILEQMSVYDVGRK